MLSHRLDEELRAGQVDLPQRFAKGGCLLRGDAACPPVDDAALRIERAEVASCGDVLRLEIEVDTERLEDATADVVAQRIVPEQREVAGAAPRRDPVPHRHREAAGALCGEKVHVRGIGRLELAAAGLRVRQPAQAIDHGQHDLRVVRDGELTDEI